jgi:hypothetical protein
VNDGDKDTSYFSKILKKLLDFVKKMYLCNRKQDDAGIDSCFVVRCASSW